ncbi:hypothetical protein [Flavobacterium crassostreae]|uniref:TonB C-terminal domain-containing protein n=1 Tax=Flavobacterium crassostreae TaxID=1763534 RepID=A0A1B9E966_9FLAO|nr:hypothetical protein [Flavobacterium crassostreae]OCB78485.1 hypothetical protein LPBF_02175 [Flavobacterium crassostreae]
MKYYLLILFLVFNSCNYFDKQIPSEKELLQKELNAIDWNEVDEYPSFVDCNKMETKLERQHCFFEYLATLIQEKIRMDSLATLYPELDTIAVKVTVYPSSKMKFEPQFPKDSVAYDVMQIDSILHARLIDFPKVSPAIKRGIPVKTQFILPVIIKAEP